MIYVSHYFRALKNSSIYRLLSSRQLILFFHAFPAETIELQLMIQDMNPVTFSI